MPDPIVQREDDMLWGSPMPPAETIWANAKAEIRDLDQNPWLGASGRALGAALREGKGACS